MGVFVGWCNFIFRLGVVFLFYGDFSIVFFCFGFSIFYFYFFEIELKVGWVEWEEDLKRLGAGEENDQNIVEFKKCFK